MEMELSDEEELSEEEKQLVAIGEISRSEVAFERSLQELCVRCIVENAPLLHSSPQIRQQFAVKLPVVLRRTLWNLLKRGPKPFAVDDLSPEQSSSLAQLLLNEAITEFDFHIYNAPRDQNRNGDAWRMLTVTCPRLTRVTDEWTSGYYSSPGKIVRLDVLPHLLRMPSLEHINLRRHLCSGRDLAKLAKAFPNLKSLCISLQLGVDYSPIFKMQKLEHLWVGITILTEVSERRHIDKTVRGDLLQEFTSALPRLQEATVYDAKDYKHAYHNSRFQVLQRPLALRSLRLKEGLNGWTPDMLPHVTELHLDGILADRFVGFDNLTRLEFLNMDAGDVGKVLMQGRQLRLERLELDNSDVDPYLVFHFCRSLKVVRWFGFGVDAGRPDLYPLNADHFAHLRSVFLLPGEFAEYEFPSDIQLQLLKAPLLEEIDISRFFLTPEEAQELLRLVRSKQILQRLAECSLDVFTVKETEVEDLVYTLFKILPCYAPRLRRLVAEDSKTFSKLFIDDGRFVMFKMPDFDFESLV